MGSAVLAPAEPVDEPVRKASPDPLPGSDGSGDVPTGGGAVVAPSPSERWEQSPVSVMRQLGWARPWSNEQWCQALAHLRRYIGVCQVGFWCLSSGVGVLFVFLMALRLVGVSDVRALAALGVGCGVLGLMMLRPWLVLLGRERDMQEALVTWEHVDAWEQSPRALAYLQALGGSTVPLLVGDVRRLAQCYNEDVAAGLMRAREVVPDTPVADDKDAVLPEVAPEPLPRAA